MTDSKALAVTSGTSNVELFRASTDAANLCKAIVVETAKMIGDRKYVQVEGWQAIAVAHGCTASARAVEAIEGGVRAIGEIRRMSDGAIIAEAEGFVGEDEPVWYGGTETKQGRNGTYTKNYPKRAMYAIRAMAQTRAISRACRSAFAHVVVMMNAGLSTTPAEEVPDGGFSDAVDADFTPVKENSRRASQKAEKADGAVPPAERLTPENRAKVDGAFARAETAERVDQLLAHYREKLTQPFHGELLEIYDSHKRRVETTAPQTTDNPFEDAA